MIPYKPFPVLFGLGPLNFYSYGLMIAIAFFVGLLIVLREAKRKKLDERHVYNLVFWILISGFFGARLFFVLSSPSQFTGIVEILKVWRGGLAFYGGVVFALAAFIIYAKKYKLNFWKTADTLAPAIPLAHSIARIGCFLRGCCYGIQTNLVWAINFGDSIARHPTQLYSVIGNFLIFVYLWKTRKKKNFSGALFLRYLMIYPVFRFLMEFLRANPRYYALTPAQYISIAIFFISLVIYKKTGGKSA